MKLRVRDIRVYDGLSYEDQFAKNEKKANQFVVIVSFVFLILIVFMRTIGLIDYSQNIDKLTKLVQIPLCILVLITDAVAYVFNFDRPWIKYMLMAGLILMCDANFFIFTIYVFYLPFVPIFLATRYFNKRFIVLVTVTTGVLVTGICACGFLLTGKSEVVDMLHKMATFDSWNYIADMIAFILGPALIWLFFYGYYAISLTNSGKELISNQAESNMKIALVDAELDMAAEIQESALPEGHFVTANHNFSIVAKEVPAREVGGDFYDYFMLDESTLAVLVADVSDKGIPAAMFMMSAKKAIRCAAQCSHTMDDAVRLANKLVCQDNKSGMFLTMWLALIDIRTGVGKYVNAGHLMPLLRSADGKVRMIENEPDLMIGNFPDMPPKVNYLIMQKGDTLILYTDGITDAVNEAGESFGMDRLRKTMEEAPNDSEKMLELLRKKEIEHIGNCAQFDDMTALALRCENLEERYKASFALKARNESTAQFIDMAETILKKYGCPDDVRRNIETAIDEVCTNIVDYAYDGEEGMMGMKMIVGSNFAELTFTDNGKPFNPLERKDPDLEGEPQIGGLGIYLIKNLMEEVTYSYENGTNKLSVGIIWNM